MELLARQKDLNFQPGERHLYSNSGYTLMALVVSRVSGQSFREFTTERIFKPLGMVNTHFRDNFSETVKNQAYGYAPDRSTFRLSVTNFDTAGATSLAHHGRRHGPVACELRQPQRRRRSVDHRPALTRRAE